MESLKHCKRCDKYKPRTEFYHRKDSKDGLCYTCKECALNIKRTSYYGSMACKQSCSKWARKNQQKIKLKVLSHYSGGTPRCAKCGFSDSRALSLDHINGDGCKKRKANPACGKAKWYIKNNYPEGIQVLCMNCQFIKREVNGETAARLTD